MLLLECCSRQKKERQRHEKNVAEVFPDSDTVNHAHRALAEIVRDRRRRLREGNELGNTSIAFVPAPGSSATVSL